MAKAPLPAEVRAARAFLRQRGIRTEDLSPRTFAQASKESQTGFKNTLRIIGHMYAGGQNNAEEIHQRIRQENGEDTDQDLPGSSLGPVSHL